MPKAFVGESFTVAVFLGTGKTWIRSGGGSIKIFRRKFFVSQCRKYSQMNPSLLFFRNFAVAKKFKDKRGGVSRFSAGKFLSHSAENFCRGILCCCVIFGYRKSLDKTWGVEYQDVLSTFFVSQCRKKSQVNLSLLFFRKIPVAKEILDKRWEYQDFPSENFCLTVPKIFVWELLNVELISGTEKTWIKGGGVSRFPVDNFLFHSAEKLRKATL